MSTIEVATGELAAEDKPMGEKKLSSCPFCNGAGLMVCHNSVRGLAIRATKGYRVECQGECHAMTCYWHTEEQARRAWSTRPDSKRSPDLTNYPNLAAVLQGCVSGTLGEWPGVRAELSQLLESFGVPDSKPEQDCKSFCKLFSEAKLRDEFYAEKCRLCRADSKPYRYTRWEELWDETLAIMDDKAKQDLSVVAAFKVVFMETFNAARELKEG